MRIAIFSDIHGNCVALDAVLADLQLHPVDHIVCLGDAIQGGPQPAKVVNCLRELNCRVVMGNADAWLLTGEETGNEGIIEERRARMNDIRAWSLGQLSPTDRAFIQSFSPTVEMELEADRELLCFHGSPASFDDVILPDLPQKILFQFLGAYNADVMTGGHTHVQQMRRISSDERFYFNRGSVGFAYSHHQSDENFKADPWAEYAILTSEGEHLALEFRRIPFDVVSLIAAYQSNGYPHASRAIAQYLPEY